MRKTRIGICDSDPNFVIAICNYFNRYENYKAVAFTNEAAIRDYLMQSSLDLVVLDDETECTTVDGKLIYQGVSAIIWKEGIHASSSSGVFKYQSLRSLFLEIQAKMAVRSREEIECQTVAVFSPLGRCGKTSIAKHLASSGGIYIGLETFSGSDEGEKLSEVLYLAKSRQPGAADMVLNWLEMNSGCREVYAAGTFLDTKLLNKDDIIWLNKTLLQSGRFSKIVYDIGAGAISDLDILSAFDEIEMPILSDRTSINKIRHFENAMKDAGLSDVLSRIKRIRVMEEEKECIE